MTSITGYTLGVIDVHVHLAALPTPTNGCRVSPRMVKGFLGRFIAWKLGLPIEDPEATNRIYLQKLTAELGASRRVKKAVLLAMDGVYDEGGRLDEQRTHFLIANDCVLEAAKRDARFLAGVSINPMRRDAVDELERCAEAGARLVKVLPNAQNFDPSDRRHLPFYEALAKLQLPMLTHVGFEFSLIGHDQTLGDLRRWEIALDRGVGLIAAHGCSNGVFLHEKHFPAMLEFARRFKRFFVDVSALTLPSRAPALLKLRHHPEIFDRLLFGTDYPLPVFALPTLAKGTCEYLEARSLTNRFDRQAAVIESLGITIGRDFETLMA